jgi:hypothetical protein
MILTEIPDQDWSDDLELEGHLDLRGIIAVDQASEIHVLATSFHCDQVSLFENGTGPEYNCIRSERDDLKVGCYHVRFEPVCTSDRDFYVEFDIIEWCSTVPEEFGG